MVINKNSIIVMILLLSLQSCSNSKIFKGTLFIDQNFNCTLVGCKCCNYCFSDVFLKTKESTYQLDIIRDSTSRSFGTYKDPTTNPLQYDTVRLICYFGECEEKNCYPLILGREYQIKGFIKYVNENKVLVVRGSVFYNANTDVLKKEIENRTQERRAAVIQTNDRSTMPASKQASID